MQALAPGMGPVAVHRWFARGEDWAMHPFFAPHAYWTIDATLREVGLKTWPYHAYVPSFGEWGFVLASRSDFTPPATLPTGLRFLSASNLATLFDFPSDMARVSMSTLICRCLPP